MHNLNIHTIFAAVKNLHLSNLHNIHTVIAAVTLYSFFKVACYCNTLQPLKLHLTMHLHTVLAAVMLYSLPNLHLTKHTYNDRCYNVFFKAACCCNTWPPLSLHLATPTYSAYYCNTLRLLNYI